MILIADKQLKKIVKCHRTDKNRRFSIYCDRGYEYLYKDVIKEYPYISVDDNEESIKGLELSFDTFYLLPSKLRKAIINDRDVLSLMVKANMKQKRFDHSVSVAKTCEMLASYHHVDKDKAYIAGLLHDVTKELDIHDEYFKFYDPEKIDYPEPVKHSFSAKYYLKDKLGLTDKEILDAVYNHTICSSHNKLCRIIYIADKREPLRGLDASILDEAKKDLNGTYEKLVKDVNDFLKQRGKDERIIG